MILHEAYARVAFDRLQASREQHSAVDPLNGGAPDVTTRTDEEARALADTPHLTGDPEWDAMELEATAPDRDL